MADGFETVAPRMPSPPRLPLPAGACDAHAHVFGPYDQFPFAGPPSYPPPLAPFPVYAAMLDRIGTARGVLTQPAPYNTDVRALLDALVRGEGRLRGIATATAGTSDAELAAMRTAGVAGLRFTEMQDPKSGGRYKGSIGTDELAALAPRMKALGLHAQVWAKAADLVRLLPALLALDLPIVLDHMGCFDPGAGLQDPALQRLLDLLRDDGRLWVKLSLCRNSRTFPDYPDIRPVHDAFVAANPDRLVWGSDWPFVRMGDQTPDVGHLLDLFHAWVDDAALRRRILVDNPAVLYGFEGLPS
jgi:predicted TIM-barrel fold metal-dependent hydrolase